MLDGVGNHLLLTNAKFHAAVTLKTMAMHTLLILSLDMLTKSVN